MEVWWVYFNDFETSVDSEWSNNKIEQAPSGESFLGHFGNDNLTLSIADLATHERIKISFDLYIIRTWDSDEEWRFSLDSEELLYTSFSAGNNQSFPEEENLEENDNGDQDKSNPLFSAGV